MVADNQDNVLNSSTVILNLFQNLISLRPGLFQDQHEEFHFVDSWVLCSSIRVDLSIRVIRVLCRRS
jgi:hypothetical protein